MGISGRLGGVELVIGYFSVYSVFISRKREDIELSFIFKEFCL